MTGIGSRGAAGTAGGQGTARPPEAEARPASQGWPGFKETVSRNRVTLVALALVAIQVLWRANTLAHSYFQQDDFEFTARALRGHLDASYLLRLEAGQLMPGVWLVMWILARIGPYDWGLWGGTMLVLQALAGLATLRALRTLFGSRPMILVPLAVSLYTPLIVASMTWFAAGIIIIPLQIAIPMALDAHVRYVRDRRTRHLVFAACWLVFGMAFYLKSDVIPLLLFAVTSGFMIEGPWPQAMFAALRRYWRAWVVYAVLVGGHIALYLDRLHTSSVAPHPPLAFSDITTFGSDLITKSFIPGAFGGPWGWGSLGGPQPFAQSPAGLRTLSWLAAALVIVASLWFRRHAWRAWAILLGWLIVADVIPVAAGRLIGDSRLLGLETRYVADAVPVLAICLALAFLPLLGERDAYRAAVPAERLLPAVAGGTVGVFLLGSVWSVNSFTDDLQPHVARSYVATADAAIQNTPSGTVILDRLVPPSILNALLAGREGLSLQSRVLAPLVRKNHKDVAWALPANGAHRVMIFDSFGRLHPAAVAGISSMPHNGCYLPTTQGVSIPFPQAVPGGNWAMQIAYFGDPAIQVGIYFGGHVNIVTLPRSTVTDRFVPISGGGSSMLIRKISPGGGVCIASITVGQLQQQQFAAATPALPVPG